MVAVAIVGRGNEARLSIVDAVQAADGADAPTADLGPVEIGTAPLSDVRVEERVGNAARHVHLPDGSTLELLQHDAFEDALRAAGAPARGARIHGLERHALAVAIALVGSVLAAWLALYFAGPALARHVAESLPAAVDARIGEGGLALLDEQVFAPSGLPPARRQELGLAFAAIVSDAPRDDSYRLELRRCGALGPNAFALPSGIVVLCDELVGIAKHDDELRAVLAHEVGHLVHRHSMRLLLQSSIVATLVSVVVGDVGGTSSLVLAVPAALLESGYSREFEQEADAYAYAWLDARGIDRQLLPDLLERVEAEVGAAGRGWFSTHPSTEARRRQADGVAPE